MSSEAELQLEFSRQSHRSVFRCPRQDPPWKIVRGFTLEHGESLVHLNNVSGGIFGGDALKLSVRVHCGAEAQITTTGATRIYRPRPEAADAILVSDFKVGKDAVLEYLPDALIPFRSSRAFQRTSCSLDEGATLFFWETVAPGRTASGERFDYERLRLVTEVDVQGRAVFRDRLLLEPANSPMRSPARFADCSYLVTFLAMRAGLTVPELRALEQSLETVVYDADFQGETPSEGQPRASHWGVTTLPAHGVLVRGMVDSAVRVPAMLQTLWSQAKYHLCGRVAIAPRKTY
jgi:urease accessory protein